MVGSTATLATGNVFVAVFMIRAFTVSGVRLESFCNISATVPETTGVAMLVPLIRKYCGDDRAEDVYSDVATTLPGYSLTSVEPGASSETVRFPGATKSGLAVRSM